MTTALYDPSQGYYARETRQVGRGGDFFTSVSVGPLFGELLARRFLREWKESGMPGRWRIIECGAHDGTLAADILKSLASLCPDAFVGLEYVIIEPLPLLREAQRKTLASFGAHQRLVSTADELFEDPLPGIAFGNELLDALPFHVIERHGGRWLECRVANGPDGEFVWETHHEITDPQLRDAVAQLGGDFPDDDYRTEIRTNFAEFLAPLTRCLSSGLLVWPDYGFARPEYYHPDRRRGTLRTYSKHRAAENPLTRPGEIDITAHVDFTAVAEAALELGCQPGIFRNQGAWLTENSREWLLELEGQPAPFIFQQFQTLTHPAHLGGSFHVFEMHWNQSEKTLGAANFHRLALQACPRQCSA